MFVKSKSITQGNINEVISQRISELEDYKLSISSSVEKQSIQQLIDTNKNVLKIVSSGKPLIFRKVNLLDRNPIKVITAKYCSD